MDTTSLEDDDSWEEEFQTYFDNEEKQSEEKKELSLSPETKQRDYGSLTLKFPTEEEFTAQVNFLKKEEKKKK
jgi:hypothetical protein